MGPSDRFSPDDVQRILGLTIKQLDYWDRLRLVSPRREKGNRSYDFRDLIALRTVKQLADTGVSASRVQRAVTALRQQLSHIKTPLAELRVLSDGGDVIVERGGARLKPISGQFVLNFETRELDEQVRVLSGRSADDWLALAVEYEAGKKTAEALDAYQRALQVDPEKVETLLNFGTVQYETGNLQSAQEFFSRALALDPANALGHFNLASVLEECGQIEAARQHLRQAIQLRADYADAHFNLALVCEKLSAWSEAREHWQIYIKLDPTSAWCSYARRRLATRPAAKTARRS